MWRACVTHSVIGLLSTIIPIHQIHMPESITLFAMANEEPQL